MNAIFKFMEDNNLKNLFLDGWDNYDNNRRGRLNIFCFGGQIKICRAYGEQVIQGKTIPLIFIEDMLE